jgi:hypothetical protein
MVVRWHLKYLPSTLNSFDRKLVVIYLPFETKLSERLFLK